VRCFFAVTRDDKSYPEAFAEENPNDSLLQIPAFMP